MQSGRAGRLGGAAGVPARCRAHAHYVDATSRGSRPGLAERRTLLARRRRPRCRFCRFGKAIQRPTSQNVPRSRTVLYVVTRRRAAAAAKRPCGRLCGCTVASSCTKHCAPRLVSIRLAAARCCPVFTPRCSRCRFPSGTRRWAFCVEFHLLTALLSCVF
jgi:hypothetical protein